MSTITFKVDDKIKLQAQDIFDQIGLSFSGALIVFLKSCIINKGIPFELKVPATKDIVLDRIKESEQEENLSPRYKNMKDLVEALNA